MAQKKFDPIYIVGPTASGKSDLAIRLASKTDATIISADSMQVYCGLDVGTAKESVEVRNKIPHKLIDIKKVYEEFSVAEFAELARSEIQIAQSNSRLPIVVGGTGLYFEALFYPMSFANTVKNPKLRSELQNELEQKGAEHLHKKLEKLDEQTARRLHTNDTKRIIRALEIIMTTGNTLEQNRDYSSRPAPDALIIGLTTEREKLYERINKRVDIMFDNGLINEVYSVGSFDYQSMQAIGYKEFKNIAYTKDGNNFKISDADLKTVKEQIKQHTRNYAKRQLTWFKRYGNIKWFDCADVPDAVNYALCEINKRT